MLNLDLIKEITPFILQGVTVTLKYTVMGMMFGLPLGFSLAMMKIAKAPWKKFLANTYTSVFRGTPLLVQLLMIFHAIPELFDCSFSIAEAAVLAFSLNCAAYTSEIIRGGIAAIDPGQWDGAHVLGFSRVQTLRHIILPQVFRIILPSLVNELIDLLKESSLVYVLGGEWDLLRRAQIVTAQKFVFFEPYFVVALTYFFLVKLLTLLSKLLEKRLTYG